MVAPRRPLRSTGRASASASRRLLTTKATGSPSTYPILSRPPSAPTSSPHPFFSPSHISSNEPQLPSDSSNKPKRVSDSDYEVRLGRAVSLLRGTLEDFMRIGIVDYDLANDPSASSGIGLPGLERLGLGAILEALGASNRRRQEQLDSLPPHLRAKEENSPVYHPNIVFKFRPPTTEAQEGSSSPAPSQNTLIKFSGRTPYFASAYVLRHALSALFSETRVTLESIKLHRDSANSGAQADSSRPATLLLRITFSGSVRVTQQIHDYTVIFRYRFDEDTGMIIEHKVERIEPAPGKKIWAGLTAAFARLAGFQPGTPTHTQTPSGCQHLQPVPLPDAKPRPKSVRDILRKKARQTTSSERADTSEHTLPVCSPVSSSTKPRASPASTTSRAVSSQWQKRRTYTTQSKSAQMPTTSTPLHHESPSPAVAAATNKSGTFFSHPRDAADMPGPSLWSILVPPRSLTATGEKSAISQPGERSMYAPPSNDPLVVSPAAMEPSSAAQILSAQTATVRSPSLSKIVAGLSKSNLTVLVTLTGMAGYALCPAELVTLSSTASILGGPVGTLLAFAIGTAACSASANAINQLREVPYDAQMARTRNRLLPSRSISPLQAATFATVAGTTGVGTLALLNPLTAILGAANIYLYAFVYTPMKRRHIANTWIGAVVGALPPLMGWAACTGTLNLLTDTPAWCLAALLFAWQFPHFNSLSHNLSSEYARGGYRMMSVTNPSLNRRTSLRYALALLPICSVALPLSGAVSPWAYAILSLPPNCLLVAAAFQFWRQGTEKSARWCFWVSLIHLPAVMVLAMMTKKSLVDAVVEWVTPGECEGEGEEVGTE